MSKPLKLQIIENAKALIQDERHWCRGELATNVDGLSVDATDSRAIRRCALGALVSAAYQLTHDHWQAYDLAINALRPTYGSATLVRINDMRGHAAVLALLDDALAVMCATPMHRRASGCISDPMAIYGPVSISSGPREIRDKMALVDRC